MAGTDYNEGAETAEIVVSAPSAVMDPVLAANKLQEIHLLRQKLAQVRSDGLKYYRPHPKQALFHAAGGQFKRRMCRSGNRFGKSTMGVAEDCAWARGERVWLPESDPARRAGIPQRPVRGVVITTDWDLVEDVFTGNRGQKGKFWSFLPPDFVKSTRRNHSGSIDTIECQNGSLIKFDTVKSFMSNPQGSESADWDFVHVDEPCPEAMYKAYSRGLIDRGGSSWFTLTPLREPWINDYFFPADTGETLRDFVWSIDGSTYDNPYLTPANIAMFEAELTEDEKQCRIHGIPLHLAGLVYKEFSQAKHVLTKVPSGWRDYLSPPRDYSVYVFIDPHPQTPHAVLFCAVSPFLQRFYYTDIFERCSIAALCKKIKERLDGRQPIMIRIDPLAYINNPITETNMADEFADNGIIVEKATKALEHGIMRVRQELGGTQVFFSPECRRTLWEIHRYCWDEKDNRPVDKDDHMMENLYRCELENPTWIDPTPDPVRTPELEIRGPEFDLEPVNFTFA